MFPYRSLPVGRFESWMDLRCGVRGARAADGDARPPPASEVERGCLLRASKRLSQRLPVLRGLLGQQMPLFCHQNTCGFWRALRAIGSTAEILLRLASEFKTSLLRAYRSLLSPWQRAPAPG